VKTQPAHTAVTQDPGLPVLENPVPLRALHMPNFLTLLRQLGASLLVTTSQAGRFVLVRDEGGHLNPHCRAFQAPLGTARDGHRLPIGTTIQVGEDVNPAAVAARLGAPGTHGACFLPRSSHIKGIIPIHEMTWAAMGQAQEEGGRCRNYFMVANSCSLGYTYPSALPQPAAPSSAPCRQVRPALLSRATCIRPVAALLCPESADTHQSATWRSQ
jgi:hypothetical protein